MVVFCIPRRKTSGIYLALWTDPEGVSCFSIYQISWIKIKKQLFVNKRLHLGRVCLHFNWKCFMNHFFYDFFVANSLRKFLCTGQYWHRQAKFCLLLVFASAAASFTAKILSLETVAKREAISNPVPNSEYPRIFRVTGANQNARKLLSTDLANT